MKVKDLVEFSTDKFFDGAVQASWFYDSNRLDVVADSFVFHGPKYFGVTNADVKTGQHKLIDTASFVKNLTDKIYTDSKNNNFLMTIAGYGAGKSHFAVCLGALYSGFNRLSEIITQNISKADKDIGGYVCEINNKKNLVLILNGMDNFNLDAEVLKCARITLAQNGIDDSLLKNITKSYDVAKHFVEQVFTMCEARFISHSKTQGITETGDTLKHYLVNNVETDNRVLKAINDVYFELNGSRIYWDRGISAGDILTTLQNELCGYDKPFNKLLILFDEFGRYIEYASANPEIAGDASLQQVFESVQNANGNIIFLGFIQYELSEYLNRIEKTSSIVRYIGRYKGSENLYISTNFETILANLVKKVDQSLYEKTLGNALLRYDKFHSNMFSSLNRWDKSAIKKTLWTEYALYKTIVLEGCYPFHPITVWLLSNMHSWMQQRSAIAFASEMIHAISEYDIINNWLPYVYPTDIIDSGIYNEMLNAEENGQVSSQFCMLYRDIISKIGNKLSDAEIKILRAVLIINICNFSFVDREDALTALGYCSGEKKDAVQPLLIKLENSHGVITFDEDAKTFDLVAETSGFNDFKRYLAKYRPGLTASIDDCSEDIINDLSMNRVIETDFAQEKHISSTEWSFSKRLMNSYDVDEVFMEQTSKRLSNSYSGESPRGFIVYAYCDSNAPQEISRISKLISKFKMQQLPFILLFLDDNEKEVLKALVIIKTMSKFTSDDERRFSKHIRAQTQSLSKKVCNKINSMIAMRILIDENGAQSYNLRLSALCSAKFNELFTLTPPFMFDGFNSKNNIQAKKYLTNICIKLFDRTLLNIHSYQALTQEEKNRVKATLATKSPTSWQVFDDACNLVEPGNTVMKHIYDEVVELLDENEAIPVNKLFGKFSLQPYGMNDNALTLFIFYFIAIQSSSILCFFNQEKLVASHLSDGIFKQSKLVKNELLKIRIQKNANQTLDNVADICSRIMSNTSLDNYSSLKASLENILSQEVVSAETQLLISQAQMRLDETLKIKSEISARLDKATDIIEEAKKSLKIIKFTNVFDYLADTDKPIVNNLPFMYSLDYINAQKQIENDIDTILKDKYRTALSNFSCKITQLSQAKSALTKVAKILRKRNYSDLADETEKKVIDLENELLVTQKYESSIVECEKDLSFLTSTVRLSFNEYTEGISKLNNWKLFFKQQNNFPTSISSTLFSKIDNAISIVESKIADINLLYDKGIDGFTNANNIEDLHQSALLLQTLEQMSFDDARAIIVINAIKDINTTIELIEGFPKNLDDIQNIINQSETLEPLSCKKVLYKELVSIQNKLLAEQQVWINRNLEPAEKNLNNMSADECANWIEKTQTLPIFLDADTRQRYKKIAIAIENQLHNSRVQGVVSMFNNLTDDEKAECLKILTGEHKS